MRVKGIVGQRPARRLMRQGSLSKRHLHATANAVAAVLFAFALSSTYGNPVEAAAFLPEQAFLEQLPGGLRVDDSDQNGKWNRVVLLARPKISSGDVNAISSSLRPIVSKFILSIVADVQRSSDGSRFELQGLGVGYSTSRDRKLLITTLGEVESGKVSLGMFEKPIFKENLKQIERIPVIAMTESLAVFDAPAIVLRDGEHRDFTMRHFVWINSKTGTLSTLVWLIEAGRSGRQVAEDAIRWMPSGMKESREIHVDGGEFSLLGIPGPRAFALEDLPPGKEIPWTAAARALAAKTDYSKDEIAALAKALNDALAAVREKQGP